MGMTGPLPSENSTRKRSVDPVVGWVDLPPEGRRKPVPQLPPSPYGEWTDEGKQMWIRLWQSPQATQWDDTNFDAITRYVILHEKARVFMWDGPMLTAVAQIEETHGLTPRAMRRLFWRIKGSSEATTMDHLAPVKPIRKEREELR